jgi:hypothetical protein
MPWFGFLGPLVPFFALLPPSIAAIIIGTRWIRSREGGSEMHHELAALREEVAALRESQAELVERLDFSERMLSKLREGPRELPRDGRAG